MIKIFFIWTLLIVLIFANTSYNKICVLNKKHFGNLNTIRIYCIDGQKFTQANRNKLVEIHNRTSECKCSENNTSKELSN